MSQRLLQHSCSETAHTEKLCTTMCADHLTHSTATCVCCQVISRMFKVTFNSGETVLEQDSLPTDDDCLYMLDTGEVDIVIAGSGEAANTNQEERKVGWLS